MYLDAGDADRLYCVAKRIGIVRKSARIEDDTVRIAASGMNAVDKLTLVIGLEKLGVNAPAGKKSGKLVHDLGKRFFAVDLGLSYAEHIEIRTV